jgi:hypothetical protein
MANPTLLTMPLCVNADKNTIPPTDAGTSGLFSEELGFQDINSLPLASGGKAPNRRDFNGVFALLGGIAYACQRGQSFEWVNTLPYLAGCVVTDPLDGNKYNAKNDVAEGGTNPSLDPTNWELFGRDPNALTREITPAFNTRDVITTSGTYTAPVTGWYKITAKGGGGGGGSGFSFSDGAYGGNGGGEGGTTIRYIPLTAGDTVTVLVGAGGTGGTSGGDGANGGDTSVTINGNTYTGGGGEGGRHASGKGAGGIGDINGCAGGLSGITFRSGDGTYGGNGGGAGGGATQGAVTAGIAGITGGGGAGGGAYYNSTNYAGGAGGDGYVWFEYFATI